MKYYLTAIAALLALAVFSCSSVPQDVPENLTKDELIQMAQTAYDGGNTAASQYYYRTIIERFGEDKSTYIAARFEIAHIYIKDKDWNAARPILNEIIEIYDVQDSASYLPMEYKKLAIIDWKKLPENSAL